jgi:hypothetical protein
MHTRPPSDYYFQCGDDVPFCPNAGSAMRTQCICRRPHGRAVESDGSVGFARKSTGMRPAGLITLKEERLTRGNIRPKRRRKLKSRNVLSILLQCSNKSLRDARVKRCGCI